MDLPPFLLNDWLESRQNLKFNLAGSTGPRWTVEDLLALGTQELELADIPISYGPPGGGIELREEIAAHHGVNPEWVIVTNGASEAFSLVLSVLSRPQGNVLLPYPTYPAFAGIAAAAHVGTRNYTLSRDRGFGIDPAQVEALVDDRSVLVLVNTPHNPTGAMLPHKDCAALAATLENNRVPLLVDEVFHPVYCGDANPSAAGIANVVVIGDMSKAFSLPGLRIGWIIDEDRERRARMIRARAYLSLSGSPIAEALALHALRNRSAILDRVNAVAAKNLAELRRFMYRVKDSLAWVEPAAGMLAFPWFVDGRNSRPFCDRLADQDVFVAPGDCFGMPEHMRLGFGSQVGGIGEALVTMERELRAI